MFSGLGGLDSDVDDSHSAQITGEGFLLKRRTPLVNSVVLLLKLAFAVAILAALWRVADGQGAIELLTEGDPIWLVASAMALLLQVLLSAMRWRLTASQLGIHFSRKTAVREYFLSQIVNQVLPGGVVGDAGRAVRSRGESRIFTAGQAVVLERVAGQFGLIVFLLAGALTATFSKEGVELPRSILIVLGILVLGGILTSVTLASISRLSHGALAEALNNFATSTRVALWAKGVRARQIAFSIGTAACNIAGFSFAAIAVGSSFSVLTAITMVPLILTAMIVPLTVAGWGFREGAAVLLFPAFGLSSTEGLATSIVFGLVALSVSLPGLVVVFRRKAKSQESGQVPVEGAVR